MKLQTQFTFPKKDLRNLDYVRKMQTLEKTKKQSCFDYPSEEDFFSLLQLSINK